MNYEIERKFLVVGEFKSKAYSHSRIQQGYFETAPGKTIRIRIRDDKAYLTIKGPSDNGGLSRYEFETEVPIDDGKKLLSLCRPGRIDKTRWLVKNGKHIVEVDEFHGDNEGLIIAEIELRDENEAYEKPDFLGKELTGDKRFYNSHLMGMPYCVWKNAFLKELSEN